MPLLARLDRLERLLEERTERARALVVELEDDVEDGLLGGVEDVAHLAALGVGGVENLARRADEPPHHRLLRHDSGVVEGVDRRRHALGQPNEVLDPADVRQDALLLEALVQQGNVARGVPVVQLHEG